MNIGEIITLQQRIDAAYPNRPKPTKDELSIWHELLSDYPLAACLEHLEYNLKWEKYPPTLKDFIKAGPETNDDLKRKFRNWRDR